MVKFFPAPYTTGADVYVLILEAATGKFWNGSALVDYAPEDFGDYVVPMTEIGSLGLFSEDIPALPAGVYALEFKTGSGNEEDPRVASGSLEWDGSAAITLETLFNELDTIESTLSAGVTVAAIGANVITAAAINSGAFTAAKFASDSITAAAAAADFGQEIADALLTRSVATVEGSAPEHCLATIILMMLEFEILSDTVARIYRSNGSTTHYDKTITISTDAKPIVKVA